jgi:hypothetical protein
MLFHLIHNYMTFPCFAAFYKHMVLWHITFAIGKELFLYAGV